MSINMKSYISALLLFLLLVDNSLSIRIPLFRISKQVFKEIGNQALEQGITYTWEKTVDAINKKNVSPPQPNAPQMKQIKGLNRIKEYLSNFGYLQSSGPFNDYLDQDTISAIRAYQQYFNLQVTGQLNNETLQHISLPRCAVPDMNVDFDLSGNVSWPKGGTQWFPDGKTNLTYGFLPVSEIPLNATNVFRNAFARWSQATGLLLNLTETMYDDADIKIGFYNFGDAIEDVVVGGSIIRLQPASNVKTGEIRLDGAKYWALPSENDSVSWEKGVLDLESVAMHQIGHLLGLDHSKMEDSVMYPTILPSQQRKVQLSDSDNKNIRQQYTANSGHRGCRGLKIIILSLVFVYMFLLY